MSWGPKSSQGQIGDPVRTNYRAEMGNKNVFPLHIPSKGYDIQAVRMQG